MISGLEMSQEVANGPNAYQAKINVHYRTHLYDTYYQLVFSAAYIIVIC